MLQIPLPRGFGLLVFVLPTYRAPRKAKRPPLALPTVEGDLLAEARELFAAGHQVAAAMTARVELERLLTTLAMAHPAYGRHWLGLQQTADWLHAEGVIGARARHATAVAADVGNRAAHGKLVAAWEVGSMFNAIASLRSATAKVSSEVFDPATRGRRVVSPIERQNHGKFDHQERPPSHQLQGPRRQAADVDARKTQCSAR